MPSYKMDAEKSPGRRILRFFKILSIKRTGKLCKKNLRKKSGNQAKSRIVLDATYYANKKMFF